MLTLSILRWKTIVFLFFFLIKIIYFSFFLFATLFPLFSHYFSHYFPEVKASLVFSLFAVSTQQNDRIPLKKWKNVIYIILSLSFFVTHSFSSSNDVKNILKRKKEKERRRRENNVTFHYIFFSFNIWNISRYKKTITWTE